MIDCKSFGDFSKYPEPGSNRHSTRSRGRTGTSFRTLVFETNASTDSAIRACRDLAAGACISHNGRQRYYKLSEKTRIAAECVGKTGQKDGTGKFVAQGLKIF